MLKIIMWFKLFIVFLLICHETQSQTTKYDIPQARIKFYFHTGFEVSIPAEQGIEKYVFHGKKIQDNKPNAFHTATWDAETVKMENGRYTLSFKDENTAFKVGDKLYYYAEVVHNGIEYIGDVKEFVVSEYANLKNQHNSNQYGYATNENKYGSSQNNYGSNQNDYGSNNNGYGSNQNGYGSNNYGYGSNNYGYPTANDNPSSANDNPPSAANAYGTQQSQNSPKNDSTSSLVLNKISEGINKCKPSVTVFNGGTHPRCADEIIFEDDFNDYALDLTKWKMERRFSSEPDYEFVVYLIDPNIYATHPLSIAEGFATLKPVRLIRNFGPEFLKNTTFDLGVDCTGTLETEECIRKENSFDIHPPLISTQFSTKQHFSFKYGRIEIRARLPNSDWSFPQIFLEPLENYYGKSNYSSGQMRVAFTSRGTNEDKLYNLYGGVLLTSIHPLRTIEMCKMRNPRNEYWSEHFHVYTLVWKPNQIVLSVDGTEYCTINPKEGFYTIRDDGVGLPNAEILRKGTDLAPFDREFYVTIGYGVGGHNDFPDKEFGTDKPWVNGDPRAMAHFWNKVKPGINWMTDNAQFKIDYVRVYAV